MVDSTDHLLKLPAWLLSTEDPVKENPFSADDPRHRVWEDATDAAEEKLSRFNSNCMKTFSAEPSAQVDWGVDVASTKFDIWAQRGAHVVWSKGALRAYQQRLINYAEAWLKYAEAWQDSANDLFPGTIPRVDLLTTIHSALIGRIEYWKAEAHGYMTAKKTHGTAASQRPRLSFPTAKLTLPGAVPAGSAAEATGRDDKQIPLLAPDAGDEIQRCQYEVHKLFWRELEPLLVGLRHQFAVTVASEPSPPKQQYKLLSTLERYAIELFYCEERHYSPVTEVPLRRSALATTIEQSVMENVSRVEYAGFYENLTFHASYDEMRGSVRAGLKNHIDQLEKQQPSVLAPSVQLANAALAGETDARRDGHGSTSSSMRLREARIKAKLSRPRVAKSLHIHGVRITPDAIKKHEEGAAKPRPNVRKAYAIIYETPEDQLFA